MNKKRSSIPLGLYAISAERALTVKIDGNCMFPLLKSGARVFIKQRTLYLPGDCLVFAGNQGKLTVHRLIGYYCKERQLRYLTQADHSGRPDRYILRKDIIGRVCGGECDPKVVNVPLRHRLRAIQRFCNFIIVNCLVKRA